MSAERELPREPGDFLGPVEPGEGTWSSPVPSADRQVGGGGPPSRRQKYALAAVLLLFALFLTVRHFAHRPEHAANSPPPAGVPFPSQSTLVTYGGPVPPWQDAFALELRVHNSAPVAVDVLGVSQGYRGLAVLVSGWLPQTVPAGGTVSLRIGLRVTDCAGAPMDAGLPFLDVTLRNTRAMETVSQILGDSYARDLSAALHSACGVPDNRTPAATPSTPDELVR